MTNAFGTALKDWRRTRRMSQLDLAVTAGVSSRHISFLETGRSRPSRGMILRLCDELTVPFSARNHLLTSAGLSPAYEERDMSQDDMQPVRDAVDWMLRSHAPYPGMALDRHWRLVSMNAPAEQLFGAVGVGQGDSLLEMLISNTAARAALENLDEILRHMVERLRVESVHYGGDAVLDDAAHRMTVMVKSLQESANNAKPAFIPAVYCLGDTRLSFFSTISQFGSTGDIALSELRIELMFPADEATKALLKAMS
ncbi:helix-turn-helix domain-containing protein [Shimia abyssi]|uniref:Xre family transcriptional regulator n=1 Tax=Shimia abyssi TaxID=1662395 RepID=A0A2P8FFY3_9RHOB|nr:helix-turn-helix transcriptional regulator [Shimia abyssi]PSL20622.1 Xre family transcriptional regulator [Shimia abyssi]